MRVDVSFEATNTALPVSFNKSTNRFAPSFENLQVMTEAPAPDYYEGEYEVTPTVEKQTMPTKGKLLEDDIIINPIPERYGLITYDHNRIITVT